MRGRSACPPCSALLAYAADDPATAALARDGGRAFVSRRCKPYVVAALAQEDPADRCSSSPATTAMRATSRPTCGRWLAPRPVRFYP